MVPRAGIEPGLKHTGVRPNEGRTKTVQDCAFQT